MQMSALIGAPLAAPARRVRQASRQSARPAAGSRLRVFAASPEEERKLDFTASGNANKGYMDGDSAGQSNIFAVEPKMYTQGSSADNKSAGVGLYNSSAAFFGAVLLAGACIVLTQEPSATNVVFDGAQPLSYYLNAFQ